MYQLQLSSSKLGIYGLEQSDLSTCSSLSKYQLFKFEEENKQTIVDYTLMNDWRKAAEDLDSNTSIGETLAIATLKLDSVQNQNVLTIDRLILDKKQRKQVFQIQSSSFKTFSGQGSQNFTKIVSCGNNPVLTIFTDKQIIFLDQRQLQMINFEHKVNSMCSSHVYLKQGLQMVCLMDTKDVLIFTFEENFDINSIGSTKISHIDIPQSGSIASLNNNNLLLLFNHFGPSQVVDPLKLQLVAPQYTSKGVFSNKYIQNLTNNGPTIDFLISNTQLMQQSIYSVSGMAPYSALYEHRYGLQAQVKQTFDLDNQVVSGIWTFECGQSHYVVISFLQNDSTAVFQLTQTSLEQVEDNFGLDSQVLTIDILQFQTTKLAQLYDETSPRGTNETWLAIIDLESRQCLHKWEAGDLGSFGLSIVADQLALGLTPNISAIVQTNNNMALKFMNKFSLSGTITSIIEYKRGLVICATSTGVIHLIDTIADTLVISKQILVGSSGRLNVKQNKEFIVYYSEDYQCDQQQQCVIISKTSPKFEPKFINHMFSIMAFLPCSNQMIVLQCTNSSQSQQLQVLELVGDKKAMNSRVLYKAEPNLVLKRLKQLDDTTLVMMADQCDQANKSVIMVYDLESGQIIARGSCHQVTEIEIITYTDQEKGLSEKIIAVGLQEGHLTQHVNGASKSRSKTKGGNNQPQIGRIRLYKLGFNQRQGKAELTQVSQPSDFPGLITSICPNFADKNELLISSGNYLFWFQLVKTTFEYSLQIVSSYRLKFPIKSLTWSWNNSQAEIAIASNEEGLVVYVCDERHSELQMKAFDAGIKQLIYAQSVPVPNPISTTRISMSLDDQQMAQDQNTENQFQNKVCALDFDGTFYLFEKQVSNNPLLRINLQSVLHHQFSELTRKFEVQYNKHNKANTTIFLLGLKGTMYKIKIRPINEQGKVLSQLSEHLTSVESHQNKNDQSNEIADSETNPASDYENIFDNDWLLNDKNHQCRWIDLQMIANITNGAHRDTNLELDGFNKSVLTKQGLNSLGVADLKSIIRNL